MSTKDQQSALEALRCELSKLDPDDPKCTWAVHATDNQCLKFLIGHKLRVDEAYKLMVKCSAWRYEYKTDDLISKIESPTAPFEIRFAKAYLPMGVIGNDLEGRPVMLMRMSAIDFPRVLGDFGLDKAIEYAIYVQEKLLQNNPRGECDVIIDLGIEDQPNPPMTTLMEARAWISALLRFLQPFAGLVDPFYPEMFSKIFFTRAPAMFSATWSVAKNFVAEATREKIEILSGKNATKRLLEALPRDVVPVFLGGANELRGLGKGGKLPKGVNADVSFLERLENDLRDSPAIKVTHVISLTPKGEEDNPVQRRAALDILRAVIQIEIDKGASSERGSWHFISGKDFLENLEDDELEKTLRQYDFDHVQSFRALYQLALQKESIKVPGEPATSTSSEDVKSSEKSERKKQGSWIGSLFKSST